MIKVEKRGGGRKSVGNKRNRDERKGTPTGAEAPTGVLEATTTEEEEEEKNDDENEKREAANGLQEERVKDDWKG